MCDFTLSAPALSNSETFGATHVALRPLISLLQPRNHLVPAIQVGTMLGTYGHHITQTSFLGKIAEIFVEKVGKFCDKIWVILQQNQ